jgi:multidrug resistance efflux pump
MKQILLAGCLAAAGASVLIVADQQQRSAEREQIAAQVRSTTAAERSIHAAGRVEGQTESVAIRPHFPGRIAEVAVDRGARVVPGQVLFVLESDRFAAQRDLAAARLAAARAAKQQLIDGARQTEIETAKQNALAADARYENARLRFERAQRLFASNAISSQEFEDQRSSFETNRALMMAARNHYETIKAEPRPADLMAADAEIASAEAQLNVARIDLDRCRVQSPCAAVVLDVDVHPGEWISPEMPEPAIELVGTERLRVVADVDERDALEIVAGQRCQITADAMPGRTLDGRIAEIEPRMEPKTIYGGWAGERTETHARRVWIDLQADADLPIGLPVEVEISAGESR